MRRSALLAGVVSLAGAMVLGGGVAAADPPPFKPFNFGQCVALGWAFPAETGPGPYTVNQNNWILPPGQDGGGSACRRDEP
jgi:hypothetical protein